MTPGMRRLWWHAPCWPMGVMEHRAFERDGTPERDDTPVHWGRYELWDVLGRGGAATVVRALAPPSADRPEVVALKFLHRSLVDDPKAAAAFRAEAALGMLLRHPNIVRTYDLEHHDGRSAIVMEYVDGRPLHTFHHPALFPAPEHEPYMVAALIAQTCDALHALHTVRGADGSARRVVHRDVTPQNILVRRDGVVKLLDYGVFFSPDRGFHTTAGFLKGKVPYLAPEYIDSRPWDHRVDVWAAGVIAWEFLTGKRLFRGESPGRTMVAVRRALIPDPSSLRPELSPRLAAVVMRALERNIARRYRSAHEFAVALREVIGAEYGVVDPETLSDWADGREPRAASGVMRVARSLSPPGESAERDTLSFHSKLTGT